MSRRKSKSGDRSAFKQAFGEVKPLRSKSPKRVMPAPEVRAARVPARVQRTATTETLTVEREGNGIITGRRASTHSSILRALEDPELEVEAECDLHGFTSVEAERQVIRFVAQCQRDDKRWVRVVVGKGLHSPGGKATLRDHVVGALSHRAAARFVLAFRTAPRHLGGTGALVLRLADRL